MDAGKYLWQQDLKALSSFEVDEQKQAAFPLQASVTTEGCQGTRDLLVGTNTTEFQRISRPDLTPK